MSMMVGIRGSVGGAAAASGITFQQRVAAWVATMILAEQDAPAPWGLPTNTTLEALRCETEHSVDDLLVAVSDGQSVPVQCKRTVDLSQGAGSPLATALDQFVRQVLSDMSAAGGEREVHSARHPGSIHRLLLLVTGGGSSEGIRVHLHRVLDRLRCLPESAALAESAKSNLERRALEVACGHVRRSWQTVRGVEPSDQEIHHVLSSVHVEVFEVEEGGSAEREARSTLRTAVVRKPEEADNAWTLLLVACGRFAAERTGSDRAGLQRLLLDAGIELRGPRSYRQDVERLLAHTGDMLGRIAGHARIRMGAGEVRIRRRATEELRHMAEGGWTLVIGEPGAGKTGVLHEFARALRDQGRDVVFLTVDGLAAPSLGLLRIELQLDHGLVDVLASWPGRQPGLLVIDALDAARGDPVGRTVLELLRVVAERGGRWQVVASIRKFDLRHSPEVGQLFAGVPTPAFQDPAFPDVRHVDVPRLTEDELAEAVGQAPALQALLGSASEEVSELLRLVFNLRLAAELIDEGVAPESISGMRTPFELLDRFWRHRVICADGQGDAREGVLRSACAAMVQARSLRVDRGLIADATTSVAVDELLRSQVIAEWQPTPSVPPDRYTLTFAHHILFDYAVERLLFRGAPATVVARLRDDPGVVLVVLPSLTMHFQHLWALDQGREAFWDLALRLAGADAVLEIGKLLGPSVAADLAIELADLEPLRLALDSPDDARRTAAERLLRHMVGALVAAPGQRAHARGQLWATFLERLTRSVRPEVAYPACTLLTQLVERPDAFASEELGVLGGVARRLLAFAWASTPRDRVLVTRIMTAVCRTFESDPAAGAALLRRALDPAHLAEFGHEELFWLAREVPRIVRFDAALVEEIYRHAFARPAESREPTPMGTSRILRLVSNRQQDYAMALHKLAEVYPGFLAADAVRAARALVTVLEAYVTREHRPYSGEWTEGTFDWNGATARIRTDHSSIWDGGGGHRTDEPLRMLDAFEERLSELAGGTSSGERQALLGVVIAENRSAVLWRRVIRAGTRYPETLGREILPLASSAPVLKASDTTQEIGEFLRAIYPHLTSSERAGIERAILALPETAPADGREETEYLRDCLLGSITNADLATEQAREHVLHLPAGNLAPIPAMPRLPAEARHVPEGEGQWLAEKGVPVEAVANRKIQTLSRPVAEFHHEYAQAAPTVERIAALLPELQALRAALASADADGVHPEQRDAGWRHLTEACRAIARSAGLSCHTPVGACARDALLDGSLHTDPPPDPHLDRQFDDFPSWGPATRINAADGLTLLARFPTCATAEVLDALDRLATDPVPAVRLQVAERVYLLAHTAQERMWQILGRLSREERSGGVLQAVVNSLLQVAPAHPARVAGAIRTVILRGGEIAGMSKVRSLCIEALTHLCVWRDEALSSAVIQEMAEAAPTNPDAARLVLTSLDHALTAAEDAVRRRAFGLLSRITHATRAALRVLEGQHGTTPYLSWPAEDRKVAEELVHLLDSAGAELSYAARTFDPTNAPGAAETVAPPARALPHQFYAEAGPIFDDLADVGLASLAHHLLETLKLFITYDPRGVLLRIGHVVRSGRRGGYELESLAESLVVALIEQYLAEHRALLREDAECQRVLLEILDTFVAAGWPAARSLVYHFDEVFR